MGGKRVEQMVAARDALCAYKMGMLLALNYFYFGYFCTRVHVFIAPIGERGDKNSVPLNAHKCKIGNMDGVLQ